MKKILVVDDQPHVIRVIKLALDRKGHKVDVAYDGKEALRKLHGEDYDVLITDFQMPRMDGRQLCEAMYREVAGPKPRVLLITAKTELELRDWARFFPDTEFLEKPLSLRQLSARLDAYDNEEQVNGAPA